MSLIALIQSRATNPELRTDEVLRGGGFSSGRLDESVIAEAERRLGLRLPLTLRAVYREIGNGGFGPGYGLLPLIADTRSAKVETVVDLYSGLRRSDPDDPAWCWPDRWVPFCDWGCAIRSCVDCTSSYERVFTFDPHARQPNHNMSAAFAATHSNLDAWFLDCVSGAKIWELMFEPDPDRANEIINPFTLKSVSVVPRKLRR